MKKTLFAFCLVSFWAFITLPFGHAATSYISETINRVGYINVEQVHVFKLTSTDQARVAFADNLTTALKYGECSSNCDDDANWTFVDVDSSIGLVKEISFALDSTDNPRIASNGSYYFCDSACTNAGNWTKVASVYNSSDSHVTLQIRSDGFPRIVSSRLSSASSPQDVEYAFCDSACDQAVNWSSISLTTASGGFSDLALTSDDRPRITYVNSNESRTIYYASCEASCTNPANWTHLQIDSDTGLYTSIVMDSSDNPRVISGTGNYLFCDSGCTTLGNWTSVDLGISGNGYQQVLLDPTTDAPRIIRYTTYLTSCDSSCGNSANWTDTRIIGLNSTMPSADIDSSGGIQLTHVFGSSSDALLMYSQEKNILKVLSSDPALHEINVSSSQSIRVVFDESINASTLNTTNFPFYGTESGFMSGTYSLETTSVSNDTVVFTPSTAFTIGEQVSYTITKAVASVGALTLFDPYVGSFHVGVQGGTGNYLSGVTYSTSGGDAQKGCAADFDGDDDMDVLISHGNSTVSLFSNNGEGSFATEQTVSFSGIISDIACEDVNNDGDNDIIVASSTVFEVRLGNGDLTFAAASQYTTNINSSAQMDLADINGDGFLDAAIADDQDNLQYAIMFNNGDGSFANGQVNSVNGSNHFKGIALLDLSQDGGMDISLFEHAPSSSPTLRSTQGINGNLLRSFQSGYPHSNALEGQFIVQGEFHGDNFIDIITLHGGTQDFNLLKGRTNSASYELPVGYTLFSGGTCVDGEAADVDGDNDMDLIAVCEGGVVSIAQNNGNGVFSLLSEISTSASVNKGVVVADFNGDGAVDVVVAGGTSDQIEVFLSDIRMNVLSTTPSSNALDVSQSSTIQVVFDETLNSGTITQNTLPVYGSFSGLISGIYTLSTTNLTNDTVTFTPSQSYQIGEQITVTISESVQSTSVKNVQGGKSFGFQVEASTGFGLFSRTDYGGDSDNREFDSGDIDNDGDIDIVAAAGLANRVNVYFNNGSGEFLSETTYSGVLNMQFIELADLNNDSYLDIITTAASGGNQNLHVYLNNGDGTFAAFTSYNIALNGIDIVSCDINADGYKDLVAVTGNGDTLSYLINDQDGTFSGLSTLATGNSPYFLDCGDINGDGFVDLVNSDFNSQTFSVHLNNGNGTFASRVVYPSSGATQKLLLKDVDADEDLDMLVVNSITGNDNSLTVHFNNGDGTFGTNNDFSSGDASDFLDVGDFDSDGDLDAVVTNTNEGTLSVFFNDGAGDFGTATKYTGPFLSRYVTIADFNGDDALDFATGGFSGNVLSIFTNQLNTAPVATTPNTITQAVDGTGYVTFQTSVSDANNDTTRLQVLYSDDGGSNFYDAHLVSVTPDTGAVDLDNDTQYQIGSSNAIDTDGGAVSLTIVWDTKSASNGNGVLLGQQNDIQLRVIANDTISDGTASTSSSFTVDNQSPVGLTALTEGAATQTTQELFWTAVTENNFSHYEIWYGESQTDVVNRTGSALKWDNGNDGALSTISTTTTVIDGLDPGTTYYFKIFAVDSYGNVETVLEISLGTSPTGGRRRLTVTSITGSIAGDSILYEDETLYSGPEEIESTSSGGSGGSGGASGGGSGGIGELLLHNASEGLLSTKHPEKHEKLKKLLLLYEWLDERDTQLLPIYQRLHAHVQKFFNERETIEKIAFGIGFPDGFTFNKPQKTQIENIAELLKVLVLNFNTCFPVERFEAMKSHDRPENGWWWAGYWHGIGDIIAGPYQLWDPAIQKDILGLIDTLMSKYCTMSGLEEESSL